MYELLLYSCNTLIFYLLKKNPIKVTLFDCRHSYGPLVNLPETSNKEKQMTETIGDSNETSI